MAQPEKANILLVDDQPGKLLSYEALLQDIGENLLMASSATEALELLLRHEVAVILIDVCMPDLNGFELARMIRDHPRFSKTAIIFVSAIHLAETDHLQGYDAGAVDYIPVPIVPELLRAKVRVFVDLYKKTKQLETLNAELESRVTERTAALEYSNSRLLKSEKGRALSLAAGNMGSWEYEAAEDFWYCDEGLNRILGVEKPSESASLELIQFCDVDEWRPFVSAFDNLTPESSTVQREMQIRRLDGGERICLVSAAASFGGGGELERIDGVMVDITERKEVEKTQKLLAREVDHRARNALAVVQAIMRLTKADNLADYATKVERRVHALAHTHELLSNARWQGADIRLLVRDEMAPYDETRIRVKGPSVILAPERAQSTALALHELATNAAKYGALSASAGLVSITWTFEQNLLELNWIESGGPPVSAPVRSGFGTKIIQASLDSSRGDGAEFDWNPSGLRCRLRVQCGLPSGALSGADPIESQSPAPAGRRRVMVVEDEALIAMFICDCLDEFGYDVDGPYPDIESALRVAGKRSVDFALLDVNVAGTPVYPVARLLRAAGVPFVFLTGFLGDSLEAEFAEVPVLAKPIEKDAIAAAATRMLATADAALKRTA